MKIQITCGFYYSIWVCGYVFIYEDRARENGTTIVEKVMGVLVVMKGLESRRLEAATIC
jgi:hypothetical protein